MATSFKQQSHVKITLQHSITHIHFHSGWLPFHGLPLHNWTISRKVHTIKSNFIDKTVFGIFLQSDKNGRDIVTDETRGDFFYFLPFCYTQNKKNGITKLKLEREEYDNKTLI